MANLPICETLCLCRVSSDKQEKNGNIISQKQSCISFAKQHGFEIDEFFDEDGISGWKRGVKRLGLDAIQERIEDNYTKKNKRTRVIAFNLERYSRNSIKFIPFYDTVERCHAELMCVTQPLDTRTAKGKRDIIVGVAEAEYDSGKKSEETVMRMRERLLEGYYQFNPPPGLKRMRNEQKQIILVRDEPRADLIVQAFEKFASGELVTKKSVAEFLRSFPVWGKKKISETQVKVMLENEVYTGIFAYEPWDIAPQEWKMDKLIPADLFLRVQKRLKLGKNVRERSDKSEDFPLRHEICCESCGRPLTGYYSKGHNGLHPYYRCFNKECEFRNKSIRRAVVEDAFEKRICHVGASDEVLNLFAEVINRVGKAKDASTDIKRQKIRNSIKDIEDSIKTFGKLLTEAIRDNDVDMVPIYKEQLKYAYQRKNEEEAALAEMPAILATEKFQTAFNMGRDFFKNPSILWKNGNIRQKRKLIHLIFPTKPKYCRQNGFQTASTRQIFNKNTALASGESSLAVPTGVEPVFSP